MKKALALVAAALPTAALAQPTFWVADDTNLYSFGPGQPLQSFTVSDEIVGMTIAPDGRIIASSNTTVPGGATYEIYELDLTGAPTLNLITDQMDRPYNSLTYVGNTLYGTERQNLVTIDLNTDAQVPVGATGATGFPGLGGAAYDAARDQFFMHTGDSDALLDADYDLSGGPDPTAAVIGAAGFDSFHSGMELFASRLYVATSNSDTGRFELGVFDKDTGAYDFRRTIVNSAAVGQGGVALIVIPTPGVASIMGLGMLAATRRRR